MTEINNVYIRHNKITDPITFKKKSVFIVTDIGLVWQAASPGSANSAYEQIITKRSYAAKNLEEFRRLYVRN